MLVELFLHQNIIELFNNLIFEWGYFHGIADVFKFTVLIFLAIGLNLAAIHDQTVFEDDISRYPTLSQDDSP